MKNKFIFIAVAILLFIIVNSFLTAIPRSEEMNIIKIAGQSIKVDLAVTPAQQAQGLSGRPSLKDNEGMLFVFTTQASRFWMKDMLFPIDIIWLSKDLKVVYIKKDARPELYPETYGPPDVSLPYTKYVLEVVSGFAEKNNLKEGDVVEFTY